MNAASGLQLILVLSFIFVNTFIFDVFNVERINSQYLIYDRLLTNAFPNKTKNITNKGFCRCINVNGTKLSENDNCLICSLCFKRFTSLIEEYKASCIRKFTNAF